MQDTLNPNRDKNISLADLYSGNPKKLQQAGINPEDATRAFIKGNNLYETGDIVPISARGVAKNIQSDLERSIELGKGAKSNVELGLTSSKEKAEGLQKSYDILNKNISTALEADNALSNTARRFGTKVDITKPIELGKDETVISPKLFHDNIGKTITAADIKKSGYGFNIKQDEKSHEFTIEFENKGIKFHKNLRKFRERKDMRVFWIDTQFIGGLRTSTGLRGFECTFMANQVKVGVLS